MAHKIKLFTEDLLFKLNKKIIYTVMQHLWKLAFGVFSLMEKSKVKYYPQNLKIIDSKISQFK